MRRLAPRLVCAAALMMVASFAPRPARAIGQCSCTSSDAYVIPGYTLMLPTNPRIFGSLRGVDLTTLRFEDPAGNKVAATATPAAGGDAHEVWIKPATPLMLGQTYFLKGARLPGSAGYPTEFTVYYQTSRPAGAPGDGADTTAPKITGATIVPGVDQSNCAVDQGLFGARVQLTSYDDDFAVGAQTVWELELTSPQGPVGTVFLAGDGFKTPMGFPFFGSTTVAPSAIDCLGDARVAKAMSAGAYTGQLKVHDWAGNTATASVTMTLSSAAAASVPDGGAAGVSGTVDGGVPGGGGAGGAPVAKKEDGGGCAAVPGRPAATLGVSALVALWLAARRKRA